MNREHYDLAFGLGMACSCSQTLRAAGLQHLSFPYDWLTLTDNSMESYAGDLPRRAEEVAGGFPGWFQPDDFRHLATLPELGRELYCVDRMKLLFNHDFHLGTPYEQAFAEVNAKYRRRIDRLIELIHAAKRVLVVRVDRPDVDFATSTEDCRLARAILAQAFPSVCFDLFALSCENGRAYGERRTERLEDGITRVTFDYRDHTPGSPPYQVDLKLTGALMKSLFTVRDYRTCEERREFARRRRMKRYARVGAENWLEYAWLRLRGVSGKR